MDSFIISEMGSKSKAKSVEICVEAYEIHHGDAPVPESSDWRALEDSRNDESETGSHDPGVHKMTGDAERIAGHRENSVVQTGDGNLVEHKNDLVHDVGTVEPLAGGHTRVGLKGVPMSTIAVHNS
jgi:hypothetical protein